MGAGTSGPHKPRWFSEHFGIHQPQYLLPFVDFDMNADVPLYIDPYAITQDLSDLAAVCHNAIVSYFEALLDAARNRQVRRLRNLLSERLAEPKQIHLGVGKRARAGAGLGPLQETQITDALSESQAFTSGAIASVQELELHIEGIGPDKISDLVANIIKGHLARFTTEICQHYGIPTRSCAVNACWDSDRKVWYGCYHALPVSGAHSYILVPKRFVRMDKDLTNHREFYNRYALDVLQREMLNADDSLVETLKNGTRRVTKKSLMEDPRFRPTKTFISHFIQEHPDTMSQYRTAQETKFAPVDAATLSGKAVEEDPLIRANLETVLALPPGGQTASAYHTAVFQLLQFVFDWALTNFVKEYEMDQGRGRIDIISDNRAGAGLFAQLRDELKAGSIPMECKNYSADLGNEEFNQLSDRLGRKSSQLGFLFCRTAADTEDLSRHLTDRWLRQDHCILLFDDTRLKRLVTLRLVRDYEGIENLLRALIRDVKFGNWTK